MSKRSRIQPSDTVSKADLQDYEAIAKYIPEAKPKQVKWIKELLDMARKASVLHTANFAEEFLEPMTKNVDPPFRLQMLAGVKSVFAKGIKTRRKPTEHEQTGQTSLFHPEAFDGGDNKTLRQM